MLTVKSDTCPDGCESICGNDQFDLVSSANMTHDSDDYLVVNLCENANNYEFGSRYSSDSIGYRYVRPRLDGPQAWSANRGNSQWMQFKLDKDTLISGVAIQKRKSSAQYPTQIKIHTDSSLFKKDYSINGIRKTGN